MRYLGGINSPSYNPLAANVTTGVTTVQQGGIYTSSSASQNIPTGQWVDDPFFNQTTLLLQADNAVNGAQNNTFLDSSSNNFTVTRNANATQGSFSPFSVPAGYWSNSFAGGTTTLLATPSTSLFSFGTNNFSFEIFGFAVSWPAIWRFITTPTPFAVNGDTTSGLVKLDLGAGGVSTGITLPLNTWFHFVVTRQSGTVRVFLNGVLRYTVANSTNFSATGVTSIGGIAGFSQAWSGYLSNLRVVNGNVPTAYQTSSTTLNTLIFTPPTFPLTTTSQGAPGTNTFLTCQSNRFVDNGTSALAITPTGDVIPRPFTPYGSLPQYLSANNSGGFYVDGAGDYLIISDNATLELGANSFCYECFFFATSTSGTGTILQKRSGTGVSPIIIWRNSANIQVYLAASNQGDIVGGTSIGSITINQWYHVAVYRIGTAIYGSLNGVITTLNANTSASVLNNSTGYTIGMNGDGAAEAFTGYFSNARLVIGSGVYTSTSAPIPTAPLTPITNSRLLISATNAAILDATAKNNFETAAQAQVSTVIKKYGSGSMFFDGSGDWVTAVNNPDINLSTGDFTIEGWINFANAGAQRSIAGKGVAGSSGWEIYCNATPTLFIFVFGNTIQYSNNYNFNQNQWYHIAVVRAGTGIGNLKMFIDGFLTLESAVAINNDLSTASPLFVGAGRGGNTPFLGYIDDFRITKGVARYTTTFVPPATALPRQGQG